MDNSLHTPVFLDQLPTIDAVAGQDKARYRLQRDRALIDLMLEEGVTWQDRAACPACGRADTRNGAFSQTPLEFRRCGDCRTIYAARVPNQAVLDKLRLAHLAYAPQGTSQVREFEFISLLNWISLTEARLTRSLDTVLDVRFSTQAPGWRDTVDKLSLNRNWIFLPLEATAPDFSNLAQMLTDQTPKAVLIPAEMDRVADPTQLLQVLRSHTTPGTLVFVATSCADGLEYEILGPNSPSFVPLDRLTLFSVEGLRNLIDGLGFKTLEISTPGRFDAVILDRYFKNVEDASIPFWSGFFRDATRDRLHDLQILLQRSLRSGIMRMVLEC